jgi:acetyl/propionyl-CoA carboxylase alpha subunit
MSLPTGDGIRNDTAVYEGYEVSVHYDPMVAKLIVHAQDRAACIERTLAALDAYQLVGLKTTIPFCRIVIDSEQFRTGNYNTFYVKEHWPQLPTDELLTAIASMAAFGFAAEDQRRQPLPSHD